MIRNSINLMKNSICQRRDRLEVRTLRCGRNNPGSNPGHGKLFENRAFILIRFCPF